MLTQLRSGTASESLRAAALGRPSTSRALTLGTISCATHSRTASTVRAAEEPIGGLNAVTDDSATAMRTGRGQRVYRTFEAVERVRLARDHDLNALVVVVSTYLTLGHLHLLN